VCVCVRTRGLVAPVIFQPNRTSVVFPFAFDRASLSPSPCEIMCSLSLGINMFLMIALVPMISR